MLETRDLSVRFSTVVISCSILSRYRGLSLSGTTAERKREIECVHCHLHQYKLVEPRSAAKNLHGSIWQGLQPCSDISNSALHCPPQHESDGHACRRGSAPGSSVWLQSHRERALQECPVATQLSCGQGTSRGESKHAEMRGA